MTSYVYLQLAVLSAETRMNVRGGVKTEEEWLNQAAEVRDEAGGEEENKAGEPYCTLKTDILIISIIKFFNLPPFENVFVTTFKTRYYDRGKN